MLIRVHEESFVLFFFNSFILLDKKPFLIACVGLIGAVLMFVFMGNKILKGDQALEFKVNSISIFSKMFFEICLMILVLYSFLSQFLLLFDHSYNFGVRTLEDYPYAVEEELDRLRNLTTNLNSSLAFSL